ADGGGRKPEWEDLERPGRACDGEASLGRPLEILEIVQIQRRGLGSVDGAQLLPCRLEADGVPAGEDEAGVRVREELSREMSAEDAGAAGHENSNGLPHGIDPTASRRSPARSRARPSGRPVRANPDDRAQLALRLHGIHADPDVAGADIQLRALAGDLGQPLERRPGEIAKWRLTTGRPREAHEPRAESVAERPGRSEKP